MTLAPRTERYAIQAVLNACDVLAAFHDGAEVLQLKDIVDRTGLSKGIAFRLLKTLEFRRLLERTADGRYRLGIRPLKQHRYRIGYAAEGPEFSFSSDVTKGLEQAAAAEAIELVVHDNRYSPKAALRNAELMVRDRVDLAVEFQADENIAPMIAAIFLEANTPLIAVEIPHPGAVYFGANNYEAGLMGGRHLGRWARLNWQGEVDEVILLELPRAGSVPRSRLTGTLTGIREVNRELGDSRVVFLDGDGRFGASLEVVRKHLRRTRAERILVSGINDPSTLGALRAFEEAGRARHAVFVSQNATREARDELRRAGSRLIGSVAYFPERFGEGIISLALDMLNRKRVPPAQFVKHRLLTGENVDHFYPNDQLEGLTGMLRASV